MGRHQTFLRPAEKALQALTAHHWQQHYTSTQTLGRVKSDAVSPLQV